MTGGSILLIIIAYFSSLLVVSWFSSRNANNQSFFIGNRKSPWLVVAIAMVGTLLSGVTFISVPGWVASSSFSYMQMVLGYFAGYMVIAHVLLPLYYRLNLTSIYSYLQTRFGNYSYKTGASFFLLSRSIGSAFRLFLVANVLQVMAFDRMGIPFYITVFFAIMLIWLYTNKGGIKTVIWTDTLQAFFMISAAILIVVFISNSMGLSFSSMFTTIKESGYAKIFFFDDWRDEKYFIKQFLSGAFICIVMTGLDQDMMQKNLSCSSLKNAQKNMYLFSFALIPVNLLFLMLGALLYTYAIQTGITLPQNGDDLFPLVAVSPNIPHFITVVFILGLIAAAYSSADSSLTALTTSFTLDILNGDRLPENKLLIIRKRVHIAISLIMYIIILFFKAINNQSVISAIFTVAGYTYGPLLGMYAFGLFTNYSVKDKWVPYFAIISPILCFALNHFSPMLFNNYRFGYELLIVNGFFVFCGLFFIRR